MSWTTIVDGPVPAWRYDLGHVLATLSLAYLARTYLPFTALTSTLLVVFGFWAADKIYWWITHPKDLTKPREWRDVVYDLVLCCAAFAVLYPVWWVVWLLVVLVLHNNDFEQ